MSEFPGVVVVGGIIIPTLIFIVGLASAKSSRIVARVFMSVAIVWILIASLSDYRIVHEGCTRINYYSTPTSVVKSIIFWLMLAILMVMRIRRTILNKKAAGNIDNVAEPKKDEYYDDLL